MKKNTLIILAPLILLACGPSKEEVLKANLKTEQHRKDSTDGVLRNLYSIIMEEGKKLRESSKFIDTISLEMNMGKQEVPPEELWSFEECFDEKKLGEKNKEINFLIADCNEVRGRDDASYNPNIIINDKCMFLKLVPYVMRGTATEIPGAYSVEGENEYLKFIIPGTTVSVPKRFPLRSYKIRRYELDQDLYKSFMHHVKEAFGWKDNNYIRINFSQFLFTCEDFNFCAIAAINGSFHKVNFNP